MSPLTLPGTIPGLLRRCSPVVAHVSMAAGDVFFAAGARAVVFDVDPDAGLLSIEGGWFAPAQWSLDLSDPTGRAHAAWWALTTFDMLFGDMGRLRPDDARVLRLAATGKDMTDVEIAALRLVCLHVAGLAP
jgi:hypothetical protein